MEHNRKLERWVTASRADLYRAAAGKDDMIVGGIGRLSNERYRGDTTGGASKMFDEAADGLSGIGCCHAAS